jgi:hypothetical protein
MLCSYLQTQLLSYGDTDVKSTLLDSLHHFGLHLLTETSDCIVTYICRGGVQTSEVPNWLIYIASFRTARLRDLGARRRTSPICRPNYQMRTQIKSPTLLGNILITFLKSETLELNKSSK